MNIICFYTNVFYKIYESNRDEYLSDSCNLYNDIKDLQQQKNFSTQAISSSIHKVSYMKQWGDMLTKMQSVFGTYDLFIKNGGKQLLEKITALKETPFQLRNYGDILCDYFNSFDSGMSKYIACESIDYSFSLYHECLNFAKEYTGTVNSDIQSLLKFIS